LEIEAVGAAVVGTVGGAIRAVSGAIGVVCGVIGAVGSVVGAVGGASGTVGRAEDAWHDWAPLVGEAVLGAGGGAIGAVRSKAKAAPLERLEQSCGDGVVGEVKGGAAVVEAM
jgi:hypothetical protein